jgi:predicted ester cyclase
MSLPVNGRETPAVLSRANCRVRSTQAPPLGVECEGGGAWLRSEDGRGELTELERNKEIVRRAIDEIINGGKLEVVDELYAPEIASAVKSWIAPFRASFPDVRMDVVDLVAEGNTVVGRFECSGTHQSEWRGHPPTGRRFEAVDEVYFFRLRDGRITESWGVEDTADRLRQLGLPLG